MRRALLLWAVCTLAGCAEKAPERAHRADWVIRSQVVFVAEDLRTERPAAPLDSFRLWFPYIAGDLYGAATTGDFIHPKIAPDYRFEVDLNASHEDLLKSLQPTQLSLSWLRVEPADARIARLSPLVMQADGIEQIGAAEWINADTRERLMLVYIDRAARITGSSGAVSFDVATGAPDYVWIATSADGNSFRKAAHPERVLLAVTPLSK